MNGLQRINAHAETTAEERKDEKVAYRKDEQVAKRKARNVETQ
jgi:hypothetical protein